MPRCLVCSEIKATFKVYPGDTSEEPSISKDPMKEAYLRDTFERDINEQLQHVEQHRPAAALYLLNKFYTNAIATCLLSSARD